MSLEERLDLARSVGGAEAADGGHDHRGHERGGGFCEYGLDQVEVLWIKKR